MLRYGTSNFVLQAINTYTFISSAIKPCSGPIYDILTSKYSPEAG